MDIFNLFNEFITANLSILCVICSLIIICVIMRLVYDYIKYIKSQQKIEQIRRYNKSCDICNNHLKRKYENTIMQFCKEI